MPRSARHLMLALLTGAACTRTPHRPAPAPTAPPFDQAAPAVVFATASLDTLLRRLPVDGATACVALFRAAPNRHVPAPSAWLAEFRHHAHPVLASSQCPRTYAPGMIAHVDSTGRPLPRPTRPPGYVDPYHFLVFPVETLGDTLRLTIERRQGSGGEGIVCQAIARTVQQVACRFRYHFVH